MRLYDSVPNYDVAKLLKDLYERPRAHSGGTLAAKATSNPDLKTTTTIYYEIGKKNYIKTATETIDLSAADCAGKVQAAAMYAAYLVTLDASGNFEVYKGEDAATAALALAALPEVPTDECPVGVLVITNTTNAFIVGTTNSDATGVTFTCYDISDIPPGWGESAVYLDTVTE